MERVQKPWAKHFAVIVKNLHPQIGRLTRVSLKSGSFNLADGGTTSENSRSTFSTHLGYSMPSGKNLNGMSGSILSSSSASRFNHFVLCSSWLNSFVISPVESCRSE